MTKKKKTDKKSKKSEKQKAAETAGADIDAAEVANAAVDVAEAKAADDIFGGDGDGNTEPATKSNSELAGESEQQEAADSNDNQKTTDQEVATSSEENEETESPEAIEPDETEKLSSVKREFWITLTDSEKEDRGLQNTRTEIEIERMKDRFASQKKANDDLVKERTAERLTMREAYLTGQEQVEVTCDWIADWTSGVKNLIRLDTGETIETVDLTSSEIERHNRSKQGELFDDENNNGEAAASLPDFEVIPDPDQTDVYSIMIASEQVGTVGLGKHDEWYAMYQPGDNEDDHISLNTGCDSQKDAINLVLEAYADAILASESGLSATGETESSDVGEDPGSEENATQEPDAGASSEESNKVIPIDRTEQ